LQVVADFVKAEPVPDLSSLARPWNARSMTLEEIYEKHVDFVWRTLRRMGVPACDLGDAVQSVFLTVHRSLPKFEGRSSITTWLFTVCRSIARERRNSLHLRHEVFDQIVLDEEVDLRADVGALVERRERVDLLESLLERLDVDQRNVLVLFELENMHGEEISEALAIPLGTVYSRLWTARKAFREALARHEARSLSSERRIGGRR
jgi:RNA polymerase sigma-70 factor (ECF subfamily)